MDAAESVGAHGGRRMMINFCQLARMMSLIIDFSLSFFSGGARQSQDAP